MRRDGVVVDDLLRKDGNEPNLDCETFQTTRRFETRTKIPLDSFTAISFDNELQFQWWQHLLTLSFQKALNRRDLQYDTFHNREILHPLKAR